MASESTVQSQNADSLTVYRGSGVEAEFGKETTKSFDRDLKEAYRKLPSPEEEAN